MTGPAPTVANQKDGRPAPPILRSIVSTLEISGQLICVVTLVVLSTAANRLAFTSWADGLGPWGAALVALVGLGALLFVGGVLGAAGRAQRPR